MSTIRLSNFVPVIILWLAITSVLSYSNLPRVNTILDWLVSSIIILVIIILPSYSINKPNLFFLKCLLSWYTFSILRGFFIAETYWDWKGLIGNTFALLLPFIALTGTNIHITRKIFKSYLKYALPLLILLFFFISKGAVGFYLAPLSVLILFLPLFSNKWKLIIFFCTWYVVISDLGARSNVIKFSVPYLFLILYFFKDYKLSITLEIVRNVLFILPIFLCVMAASGTFNVFKFDDYIKSDVSTTRTTLDGSEKKENLKSDTRSELYIEVIQTAQKYNSWWIGRSPARGNESVLFGKAMKKLTGRAERLGNEVAILNIFTWTGLVGVFLYLFVFYRASYLALNKSNNVYSKMLGLYITFRWIYAWVEDINYFTLTTFVLWLVIGMCYSKSLRKMTDFEVKLWVRGIAYKKEGNNILVLK